MELSIIIDYLVISIIASMTINSVLRNYAKHYNLLVDLPDRSRKFHKRPTPMTGGMGIFVSILLSGKLYIDLNNLNGYVPDFTYQLMTVSIPLIFLFLIMVISPLFALENNEGQFIEIKILDKISSKNKLLKLKIGKEERYKNLLIKSLKCKNSEFDDNPEITSYIQVKDTTNKGNDEVFIFNGWTFSSGPSINPFDHPVYNIWLIKCY
mgnify:CR=1 FL=1